MTQGLPPDVTLPRMRPGDLVGDRYRLRGLAGAGGMGDVFEALDELTAERVAVKVLRADHDGQRERMEREARILAELDHPGVVRHLAHARTPSGQPYLVMEWLEGEDLGTRLDRGPLAVEEAVLVGQQVARAMAAAHARGIVHRDLKPGNVFLVEGGFERIKLLDFGVAQLHEWPELTLPGTAVGTLGYMAPEQIRNDVVLGPQADVFALGCILFECLAGTPAFSGEQPLAVLAHILFQEVPRLASLRADVPSSLSELIERMLAKDPEHRPAEGAAVVAALASIAAGETGVPPGWETEAPGRVSLTERERRLLSVVLLEPAPGPTPAAPGAIPDRLRAAAEAQGGRLEMLPDGSVVVGVQAALVATDQAAQAARCALALRAVVPGRAIAVATGRVDGKAVSGEAVDRAVRTLRERLLFLSVAPTRREAEPVGLDEFTAGLLDARFDVREGDAGLELYGEREVPLASRLLMGKRTRYVGRDRELAMLEGMLSECVRDATAQAALVTAPPGMGKSRLLRELLGALGERNEIRLWRGRADPLRSGSAFGLLRQALSSACGILAGEPLEVRRAKLQARVARHVPAGDQVRVAGFLGELLGTTLPDGGSPALRAARHEARIMSEQMRLAWEDFLRAETAAGPVLLVLEDLQWGDLPTVRFVESALRNLAGCPWMVLALARPEVHELFPRVWEAGGCQEIRLRALSARDGMRLVRQVLGDDVAPELVARLVEQADGNPLYLEELIRAFAEGRGESLPGSLVAMVHARLGGLADEHRRVLRAASVFGEVFWAGGVTALLGSALGDAGTAVILDVLVERELLVRRPSSRWSGEAELAFRHTLLREAAYALLTEADRTLGHKLAGEWLEAHGEVPMVLAQHYDRGGELALAGTFYLQAGERALQAGDIDGAIARAEQALACGVPEAMRVTPLSILAEGYAWRNDPRQGARFAEEVLSRAPPGSVPWARAALARLGLAASRGEVEPVRATMALAVGAELAPNAVGEIAGTLDFGCIVLAAWGHYAEIRAILARLHAIVAPVAAVEPVARGWMHGAHMHVEALMNEDPWAGLQHADLARASFLEANHRQGAQLALVKRGMNLWLLGALAEAEQALREALSGRDEAFGSSSSLHLFCLVGTLADAGALAVASESATRMVELWRPGGLPGDEGRSRAALAEALYRVGDLAPAEREALAAVELLRFLPQEQAAARARLSTILLAAGRPAEALALASEAWAWCDGSGSFGFRGGMVMLARVEALQAVATSDRGAALSALSAARARLSAQSARIGAADLRESFLHRVPENARILALCRERLGEP